MSALTKLFVVLLVICSLLLTGALVVFVNQQNDWRAANDAFANRVALLDSQQKAADAARAAAVSNLENLNKQFADAQRQAIDDATQLRGTISGLNNTIADMKTKAAVDSSSIQSQAVALQTIQKNLGDVQTRYNSAVAELDKLRLANAETIAANTDLEKRLDATERDRKWATEQLIQAQKDLSNAHAMLDENHISRQEPAIRSASAPKIEGRIREVRIEDGQAFATINLGSADRVQKGMQLKVINPATMEFLAFLTVDTVEPNEAFGRLEGPKVKDVQKNLPVLAGGL